MKKCNLYKKISSAVIAGLSLPYITFAADVQNIEDLIRLFLDLFNRLVPLFLTLGVLYVIWSVVMFIRAFADTKQREELKNQIFWGIIGLFVILSIWSLVALIGQTFDITGGGSLI